MSAGTTNVSRHVLFLRPCELEECYLEKLEGQKSVSQHCALMEYNMIVGRQHSELSVFQTPFCSIMFTFPA